METSRILLNWSKTLVGSKLHADLSHTLKRLIDKNKGPYLLNIGLPDTAEILSDIQIPFKWSVSSSLNEPVYYDLLSNLDALPFSDNFFDVIVVSYLGIFNMPSELIFDELRRVLKEGGVLYVLDVQPWSPLAWQFHHFVKSHGNTYQFNSLNSTCRKLKLEGFRIDKFEHFFYQLPVHNQKILKYTQFLETLGPLLLFYPAGFYWIFARKVNYNVVPIDTFWLPSVESAEKLEFIS